MRNKRYDMRPQNRWDVQAGVRGAHLDGRGNMIGGYAPDGRGLGTKASASRAGTAAPTPAGASARAHPLGGGLARWEQMNPGAPEAFAAGSPANSKSANRALAKKAVLPMSDGGKVNSIVDQTFPRSASPMPPVPGKMPAAKPRRWDAGPAIKQEHYEKGRGIVMNPGGAAKQVAMAGANGREMESGPINRGGFDPGPDWASHLTSSLRRR